MDSRDEHLIKGYLGEEHKEEEHSKEEHSREGYSREEHKEEERKEEEHKEEKPCDICKNIKCTCVCGKCNDPKCWVRQLPDETLICFKCVTCHTCGSNDKISGYGSWISNDWAYCEKHGK